MTEGKIGSGAAEAAPALPFDQLKLVYDAMQRRLDSYRQIPIGCLAAILVVMTIFDSAFLKGDVRQTPTMFGLAMVLVAAITLAADLFLGRIERHFADISHVVVRIERQLGFFTTKLDETSLLPPAWDPPPGDKGWTDFSIGWLRWGIRLVGGAHLAVYAVGLARALGCL